MFYIFHGNDSLQIDEAVNALRDDMNADPNGELNTDEFDGTEVETGEIIAAAQAYPFLSQKRLVIAKNLISHITRKGAGETGKKAVELLADELPTLPDWSQLVFVERVKLAKNSKLVTLAHNSDNGQEKLFELPKDSTSWIIRRANNDYNVEIEPQAASALASVTGNDLRLADNELVKLVSYVDGQHPITESDVETLTPYVAEANIFAMVDALALGNGQQAATLLHRLLEDQQEDVFKLYGLIVSHFRRLLLAKEHLVTGGYPKTIGDALGISSWQGDKLAKQSRAFSLAQLDLIYRRLHDYDAKIKTGQIKPELALDLLVTGLSRQERRPHLQR